MTVIATYRVQTVTMAAERTNVSNDLIWQITRMYSRKFFMFFGSWLTLA
jgi:hypothetical protein